MHEDVGPKSEIYKKVWNFECEKQEYSVSQINMDNDDEEDDGNKSQKTIIELVFYYICIEETKIAQVPESKPKKNNERYPLREVSTDMYGFIVS